MQQIKAEEYNGFNGFFKNFTTYFTNFESDYTFLEVFFQAPFVNKHHQGISNSVLFKETTAT